MIYLRKMVRILLYTGMLVFFISFSYSKGDVYYRDRVAVLVYHHIDDHMQNNVTISASRLR